MKCILFFLSEFFLQTYIFHMKRKSLDCWRNIKVKNVNRTISFFIQNLLKENQKMSKLNYDIVNEGDDSEQRPQTLKTFNNFLKIQELVEKPWRKLWYCCEGLERRPGPVCTQPGLRAGSLPPAHLQQVPGPSQDAQER